MEKRVAVLSIIISDPSAVETLNALLHNYRDYIIGRMGLPYEPKHINIICVAMDAPMDMVNALNGALGRIPGITAKATYSA